MAPALFRIALFSIVATAAIAIPSARAHAQAPTQDAAAVATACHAYAHRVPTLRADACLSVGLRPASVTSRRGRALLLRDVRSDGGDDGVRVLVLGTIHGDELTAPVLAFRWLQFAQDGVGRTAIERPLQIAWRFVPVVNPDGLLATPPTRVNAHGVDLNRNFPTPNWAKEAPRYWAQRTGRDPRRYPGLAPLSEPESRFIEQQIDQFAPDLIVSIHAPLGVLDFDGPAIPPHRLGRLYLDQVGVYPGSLGHYAGVHRGIPVVTIELPHALRPPTDVEMHVMWEDLLRWIGAKLIRRQEPSPQPLRAPLPSLPLASPIQQILPSPLQPVLLPLKAR